MGTEAFWIPALISAASAGAGAYNTISTAKKQDQAAAQGIRQQAEVQKKADQRVDESIGALEGSSPEAERQKAMQDFVGQLRANRAQTSGGEPVNGSDRYATDSAAAEAGVQNFGQSQADILSRITAPGRQRQNEAIQVSRTGTDLGALSRTASSAQFLNQLRQSQIRRNPWIDAGAQTAQGVAGGMATSGAGGGLSEGTLTRLRAGQGVPVRRFPDMGNMGPLGG